MAEFNVRADAVDVEQIMRQIRSRIREKRGVDYTEEQIQELAKIRLEKFLDPKGLRSDLLEQFRRSAQVDMPPNYEFGEDTLFETDKPLVRFFRRLLRPILKLFFNPNPMIRVLHMQADVNRYLLELVSREFEVMHNLVVEMTRTGIEVRNMQMRVESLAGRLDFNERRARALEAVVQYKPESRDRDRPGDRDRGARPAAEGAPGDAVPAGVDPITGGESLRSRRRRRRRGRRSGPGFGGDQPGTPGEAAPFGTPDDGDAGDEDSGAPGTTEPSGPMDAAAPPRPEPPFHDRDHDEGTAPGDEPETDPDRS